MSKQSELDEIERVIRSVLTPNSYIVPQEGIQLTKAILDWHNKQTEKVVSADEFLNYLFRNGYVDREWDAKELEDTLNKLKESKE